MSVQHLGTGLHVLTEMLKYVSPTHVIRVSTAVEHKNLPDGMFWMNEGEGDSSVNLVKFLQHRTLLVSEYFINEIHVYFDCYYLLLMDVSVMQSISKERGTYYS